jgi:predicted Zn-dependent peptidase
VKRYAPECCNNFSKEKNKHIHQTHALIGCQAYNTYSNKKVAFTLLNNILGGPALNSRLNIGIREKYGLCYNIESQYTPLSDIGIFYIYVAMDKEFKDRIIELIFREINRLKNIRLTDLQLSAAKQQLIGQLAINEESALNEMLAMGKAYMNFNKVDSLEEINRDIMSITSEEIQDIANETFIDDNFSKLFYY